VRTNIKFCLKFWQKAEGTQKQKEYNVKEVKLYLVRMLASGLKDSQSTVRSLKMFYAVGSRPMLAIRKQSLHLEN
jgi:hypothetical protein